jgi:hypothetical protein
MDSTLVAISIGIALDPLAGIVTRYPNVAVVLGMLAALVILAEQIWPHAPIKADSTSQFIINIARGILRVILKKKG